MKTNNLLTDILRGPWLVNPLVVPEYEKLINSYLAGNFKGNAIDRQEFFAAVNNSKSPLYNGNQEPEKRIVKVPMRGVLAAYGDMCMLGADDYLNIFRRLNNDESVSSVVLDIDGPGSSVTAINMMKEFADEKKKPFVGLVNQLCSGHLWTAFALCDHVMSYGDISPDIGSIGVLSMVMDARKAMEKDGYRVMIVRARKSTTKAQQLVDFYEGKDEELIASMQDEMEPMVESFISEVKKYRPNINQDAPGIFTGSTYNAQDALKYGLIDSIGNEKKAFERAQMLVEMELY